MTDRMIDRAGLKVAQTLAEFIEQRALSGTGIDADAFWAGTADILARFTPDNAALLRTRDDLQTQIDAWHQVRRGQAHNAAAYQAFLREIGYLVEEGPDFEIETPKTDPEICNVPARSLSCRS